MTRTIAYGLLAVLASIAGAAAAEPKAVAIVEHRALEDPGSIAVVFAAGTDLQVNRATAAAIGVTLPQAVLDRASKVVE